MLARLEGILMKRVAKQRRPLITCAWLVCIGLAGARVEAQPVKVVYVVRHAEKAAQDGDPCLRLAGSELWRCHICWKGAGSLVSSQPSIDERSRPWNRCPRLTASRSKPLRQVKSKS